jgi:hypothetical protein
MVPEHPDDVAMDAVYALNRRARVLLLRLHQEHLEVQGASFSYGYGDDLPFDFHAYRAAAQRLEERGLAAWAGQTEVTSSAAGVQAIENPAILDEVLPVGPTTGTVPPSSRSVSCVTKVGSPFSAVGRR